MSRGASTAENWNYVLISVVIVTILTLLILYMPNIREFDSMLLKSIRSFLAPFPSYIPVTISEFGRANYMMWPQITACSVLVSHHKFLKAFLLVFCTQATFFCNGLLKNFVCRERPCEYAGFSFPSTHTATTMCFYGILIFLVLHYVRSEFWRYFLAVVFGIFIFLVAISRLWLGVHFPIDVIAGIFFGFIFVNLYIILTKLFD